MGEIDWVALKTEYVTTTISIRKLAEKHGVSVSVIADKSRSEGWVEARKQFQNKTVTQTVAKTSNKVSTEEANRLTRLLRVSDKLFTKLEAAMEDDKQFNRHLVVVKADKIQYTEEQVFDKVDTKAVRDVMATLRDMESLVRSIECLPTQSETEAQRVASERLELEKAKFNAADKGGGELEVTFDAGEEEWNE